MSKKDYSGPTYNLAKIKTLIRSGKRAATTLAQQKARGEFDLSSGEMFDMVLKVIEGQFDSTSPSEREKGLSLDVYRYRDGDWDIYVKMQIVVVEGEEVAKVVDFKPWGVY
jgi:hypothetical protein